MFHKEKPAGTHVSQGTVQHMLATARVMVSIIFAPNSSKAMFQLNEACQPKSCGKPTITSSFAFNVDS